MVKFSSQGRALVSCLSFSGRLVWEAVLGLSLVHASLSSSGPLHSLRSNPWRRESLPLVFLTAFSCLLVQFRGPELAVAKFGARSPLFSSGYLAEGLQHP